MSTSNLKNLILDTLEQSIIVKKDFIGNNTALIEKGAVTMANALVKGNKIILFGNGGSAADAQHIAAEFINRFRLERAPLAAIALTTDSSVITSIANDYSFENIFVKQVQALGRKKDIAIAITTSGNSPNVIKAAKQAVAMGITVIGFSGSKGKLKEIADIPFCVDSDITARIQETHITLAHILCDLTERIIYRKRLQGTAPAVLSGT